MIIVRSLQKMQALAIKWQKQGRSIGFVPTMGSLHQGHVSLIKKARRDNSVLAASLFVNPSQFGPKEDLAQYPRPFFRDKRICRENGVDVLFCPREQEMYPKGFNTWISVDDLSKPLCGAFRPKHFRGVATVVAKLFQLVLPTRAYFGQKDFQQLRVIERMVQDLHLPVKIVGCPIVREQSGLALSSRNSYLTRAQRLAAVNIYSALRAAEEVIKSKSYVSEREVRRAAEVVLRKARGLRIQYLSVVEPSTLKPLTRVTGNALVAAAVFAGKTRLIDNVLIRKS